MSNALPPQWHETEEGEMVVPVHDASAPKARSIQPAKRMPAAIIGILCMAGIVISFAQGWTSLLGQATTDVAPDMIIMESSVEPSNLSVIAGDTVIIRNESSIPHILHFETLMDAAGKPIETSGILPQSNAQISIPSTIPIGEYPFYSRTSEEIAGIITVLAPGTVIAPASSSAPMSSIAPVQAVPSSVASSSSPAYIPVQQTRSSVATSQVTQPQGTIPSNPYTIGSETNQITVVPQQATVTYDIADHMPETNAETGSAAWATIIILALSCIFVVRRAQA